MWAFHLLDYNFHVFRVYLSTLVFRYTKRLNIFLCSFRMQKYNAISRFFETEPSVLCRFGNSTEGKKLIPRWQSKWTIFTHLHLSSWMMKIIWYSTSSNTLLVNESFTRWLGMQAGKRKEVFASIASECKKFKWI